MRLKKHTKVITPLKTNSGFTLIEAMLSVALLALVAVGISAPYISGFQALDVQADRMILDSHLRSRMEVLVGKDFDSLSAGSESVTVNTGMQRRKVWPSW
jgi:prepilin-type N-terminal cleavage/methylation domain-containing protein